MNNSKILGTFLFIIIGSITSKAQKNDLNTQIIEGDLFFKLINAGSFYGASGESIKAFEHSLDSLNKLKDAPSHLRDTYDYFRLLKENDLIYRPYFQIKTKDKKIASVYVDKDEYKKISKYTKQELRVQNKKLVIKLRGSILQYGIIRCDKIISITEKQGITEWQK